MRNSLDDIQTPKDGIFPWTAKMNCRSSCDMRLKKPVDSIRYSATLRRASFMSPHTSQCERAFVHHLASHVAMWRLMLLAVVSFSFVPFAYF